MQVTLEAISIGNDGRLPLPLAGEGWGEGILAKIPVHALSLTLSRKRERTGRVAAVFAP